MAPSDQVSEQKSAISSSSAWALRELFTDSLAEKDDTHDAAGNLPDLGDAIDIVTFGQILEMDESEDDRDFSSSIVFGFFEQAEETFDKMDEAL